MVQVMLNWLVLYLSKSSDFTLTSWEYHMSQVRTKLKPFHAVQKGSYSVVLYSQRNLKENLHNTQSLCILQIKDKNILKFLAEEPIWVVPGLIFKWNSVPINGNLIPMQR